MRTPPIQRLRNGHKIRHQPCECRQQLQPISCGTHTIGKYTRNPCHAGQGLAQPINPDTRAQPGILQSRCSIDAPLVSWRRQHFRRHGSPVVSRRDGGDRRGHSELANYSDSKPTRVCSTSVAQTLLITEIHVFPPRSHMSRGKDEGPECHRHIAAE